MNVFGVPAAAHEANFRLAQLEQEFQQQTDSYDALTTNRPYRSARTQSEALAELRRCCDVQFDREVVEAFCAAIQDRRIAKSA